MSGTSRHRRPNIDRPTSATELDGNHGLGAEAHSRENRSLDVQQPLARQDNRKVTAACLACRRRKTKCSGAPTPCDACYQHRSECIIAPGSDRRRKVPQGVLDDLDLHAPALTRLVDALRASDESSDRLLHAVRNGAPLAQVLALVDESKQGPSDGSSSHTTGATRLANASNCPQHLADGASKVFDTQRIRPIARTEYTSSSRHPSLAGYAPPTLPGTLGDFHEPGGRDSTSSQMELTRMIRDLKLAAHSKRSQHRDRRDWHPSLQIHGTPGEEWAEKEPPAPCNQGATPYGHSSNNPLHEHRPRPIQRDVSSWYQSPGSTRTFGNLPMSSAVRANGYPLSVQDLQLANFHAYEHQILPLNIPENSLLSNVMTSFRSAATTMLSRGVPVKEVLGPENPNMDLLVRDRRPTDAFSVSNWAAELCKSFPAYDFPELLRGAWLFTFYMRWLILPSPQNYAALPECYRPTTVQRMIPHAPLIDLQAVPALRDTLCLDFRDFMTPNEAAISVNWPHTDGYCLVVDANTGYTHLSKEFQAHILNDENVTFGSVMLETFPELRGHINIKEKLPRQAEELPLHKTT